MNLPTGHYLQKKKYQLLKVIGQGGFGITYKGILYTEVKGSLGSLKTDIPISIKEYFFKEYCFRNRDTLCVNVHSETGRVIFDKFKEKLIKEAKILSEVHHPNIVNVLDVFEENNTAYIAMEYIHGNSLKYTLEKDGILPETKVLKYIHQIGKALQFVHKKNILHLDIKPSNILIDKYDNARLIDFGVSKRYDVENRETSTTMLTLSKGFASIEQYDNEGTQTFSPRPDIYSLGATMYNLLTGKIPTESILRATRSLQKPSVINPSISSKTEEVIMKAMQIDPADRYQTVSEMLEALGAPPLEEEINIDKKIPDSNLSADETTLLLQSPKKKNDDEQTIIDKSKAKHRSFSKRKKNKKTLLLISLICIFAIVGSSVALLIGGNGSVPDPIEIPEANIVDKNTIAEDPVVEEPDLNNVTVIKNDNLPLQTTVNSTQPEVDPAETILANQDSAEVNIGDDPLISVDELDAEFNSLLTSGKRKMNEGDYTGAYDDLIKAVAINQTEEVKQLINISSVKMEEKRVVERKSQYEEKMSFGNYMIVRKISTGRYGAIDDKGEERIPCKYINVDIADEGRAFEREDKLFDIYNMNGELVRSDVTY